MADVEPGGQQSQGPDLANYSGDGSDLTEEQKQYLATYAAQQPGAGGDVQHETGAGSLSEGAEGEWA